MNEVWQTITGDEPVNPPKQTIFKVDERERTVWHFNDIKNRSSYCGVASWKWVVYKSEFSIEYGHDRLCTNCKRVLFARVAKAAKEVEAMEFNNG